MGIDAEEFVDAGGEVPGIDGAVADVFAAGIGGAEHLAALEAAAATTIAEKALAQ